MTNNWDETVPTRKLRGREAGPCGGARALLVIVSIALYGQVRRPGRMTAPGPSPEPTPIDVQVDPGNTEIERGTALLVVARFKGSRSGRREPGRRGQHERTTSRRSDDAQPRRPHVRRTRRVGRRRPVLSRRVRGPEQTETYQVHVFEYPELAAYRRQACLSRATRRSSPRPSRTSATSRPSRGPS